MEKQKLDIDKMGNSEEELVRILLVEDNPGDVLLIKTMLAETENFSFEMIHAERLEKALSLYSNQHFDAILLDLSLPDEMGLHTFTRIQSVASNSPIVVMTDLDDEKTANEAVKLGAQDYLVKKEVDSKTLVRSLRYSIERKRLEEKLRKARDAMEKSAEERKNLIEKLQDSLANVKQLSGLLPICSSCKKIRDDKGYWNQIEGYIRDHSEVNFSHGICPECTKKLYPNIFAK